MVRLFLLGFGFLEISIIWPIFNNYVPIFLKEEFALSATAIGFVVTWDNYLNMFIQPIVGESSDRTLTRIGRRKPWMLVGAPLAAIFLIGIPFADSVIVIMFAILFTNVAMALFRSPTVALLGDLFPSNQRSTANGIINLLGGLGTIIEFLIGGVLYSLGRITPFVFGSVVMLAAIGVVLLFIREPEFPPEDEEKDTKQGFLSNLGEILKASDRSGLVILLAILCWFLGYNALETWISSFGKFELRIDEGMMSMLTASMELTFIIFAVPSGLLATRFGRKRVIMVGIGGMVVLTL
jgi:maltose/moltooligosaccharide transporter